MPVSVRMEAVLIKQLEQEAKKLGITRSQFIIDAVERALGRKDPYQLLVQVQQEMKLELASERRALKRALAKQSSAQELTTGDKVRKALRTKRVARQEAARESVRAAA